MAAFARAGKLSLHAATKALRVRARRRTATEDLAIVIVTFNNENEIGTVLQAIRRFTPPAVPVVVFDNASSDHSAQIAAAHGARVVRSPGNIGHGWALDVVTCLTEARRVVTLDSDAFPLSATWLATLTEPLDRGCHLAGVATSRGYAHPSLAVFDRERFLTDGLSFVPSYAWPYPTPSKFEVDPRGFIGWDVGELLTKAWWPAVEVFEPTSVRGPGLLGAVWDDLVYHNFYSARRARQGSGPLIDGIVPPDEVGRAWDEAVERFLPGLGA